MWRAILCLLLIGAVCGLLVGGIAKACGQGFWCWAGYGMAGGIVVVCAIIAWLLCRNWH